VRTHGFFDLISNCWSDKLPRRFYSSFAAALACLLFVAPATVAQELRNSNSALAKSLSPPIQLGGVLKDSAIWTAYRTQFLDQSGRIVDTGNNRISHSEGQGYGMLLAVAAADRAAFDAIWSWTKGHLSVRADRLAAWSWSDGAGQAFDNNNASDGDILIAWALAEAADFWENPDYLNEARAITKDIVEKSIRSSSNHGPILMPATRGFSANEQSDGPVVNLSYWVFPAFARLAQVMPGYDWSGLSQAGIDLLNAARFGDRRVPPDWLSLGQRTLSPAGGFNARFGYDAIRIPLYVFWANAATPERLGAVAKAWPVELSHITLIDPGYRALADIAHCAASNRPYPDEFYQFRKNQNYYPATLHVLSIIAATIQGGSCVDRAKLEQIVSQSWRPNLGSLEKLDDRSQDARRGGLIQQASLALSKTISLEEKEPDITVHENEGLVLYLRYIGGALVLLGVLAWLLRQRGKKSPESWVDDKENLEGYVRSAAQCFGFRNADLI
jgi:endoglucanase